MFFLHNNCNNNNNNNTKRKIQGTIVLNSEKSLLYFYFGELDHLNVSIMYASLSL